MNVMDGSGTPLWGDRFVTGMAPELECLNRSLSTDHCLWPFELEVDRAWIDELAELGCIGAQERDLLADALDAVEERLRLGRPEAEPDEDIHTLVERWLTDEVGDLASQVRLGRSRNDLVATDTRMWAMHAVDQSERAIIALQNALFRRAVTAVDTPFPAYTHLQPAQPSRAAHWLLAHFWALERDRGRLRDSRRRIAWLPLGAAAGVGSSLPVNQTRLAVRLGFERACANAADAVASRDWAAELLFAWTQTGIDLSRLGEDLVLFSAREFGLIRLHDSCSTGSSLMPQKRNPDGAELARARGGILTGLLMALLATLKGLPAGYNKDLQEDKAILFRADRLLRETLAAMTVSIRTLTFLPEGAVRCLTPEMLAADLAEWLAAEGVPFRKAHAVAGELVLLAERSGRLLNQLSEAVMTAAHPALGRLPKNFWAVEAALERHPASGGVSRAAIAAQLEAARRCLPIAPPGSD